MCLFWVCMSSALFMIEFSSAGVEPCCVGVHRSAWVPQHLISSCASGIFAEQTVFEVEMDSAGCSNCQLFITKFFMNLVELGWCGLVLYTFVWFCFFFYRNQSIFDFSLCESGDYFARSCSRRQRVSVSRRRGNRHQKVSIFPNSVKTVFREISAHLILFWGHCLLLILSPQQAFECDHKLTLYIAVVSQVCV